MPNEIPSLCPKLGVPPRGLDFGDLFDEKQLFFRNSFVMIAV